MPDVAPCHRVLIVEDDLTSRAAMAFLLRHFGFAPVLAGTVQEAIAQIAAARPDCVVLDLMLPDGTGDRVLAAIRQQRLDIRVAVATGASDPALLSTVQALRPDVVFKKPLDMDRVTAWLRGT
ncbi:MAG TPA: response regulator [Tepidisphaeraceae bacterium]|nr:response regulator [Tepidisphaeraceae bacterium]